MKLQGLAYVEFHDKAGLEKAVAKNEAEFQGRRLSIEASRPPGPGQRVRVGGRGPARGQCSPLDTPQYTTLSYAWIRVNAILEHSPDWFHGGSI